METLLVLTTKVARTEALKPLKKVVQKMDDAVWAGKGSYCQVTQSLNEASNRISHLIELIEDIEIR